MATDRKRFTVTLSSDLVKEADILKQETFYNTSQSEMYRYLIGLGLELVNERREQQPESQTVAVKTPDGSG